MPYDGNPAEYIETEPSLEGLLRWLETQDSETKYDWGNFGDCLLCRYCEANGYDYADVCWIRIPHPTDPAYRMESLAYDQPWTYGAAAERCRALLRSR